jgi:diguanylate cyclase (GGDEF)-like protein
MSLDRTVLSRFPLTRAMPAPSSPWLVYLGIGAVLLLVHAALETGSLPQSFLYDGIGASAVAVALIGVWRHRPERVAPWLLMAAGQGLFVAGDLAWNWFEIIGVDPFPSIADVLYLSGYPFIALGLFLLIRRRLAGGDRGGVVDAAILTTAVAILSWTFFIQPQATVTDIDPLSFGISLAYPIADLLLIGVAMGLLTTPGSRTVAYRFLGISLLLLLVADQVYALQTLDGSYVSGGPLDTVYLISYLLFGATALHPSMVRLTDPHPVAVTWLGPIRLICLAVAMVTGPILVSLGPQGNGDLLVVAAGTAILSVLVLVRLAGLVGLLERDVAARRVLEARLTYQAYHDPLTGLANRRRFVDDTTVAIATRRSPGALAVLFLDLDDFKTVNDGMGHAAGDELLAAVAERLRSSVRSTDVAARLGGDEFGILLVDVPDAAYAEGAAARLLEALDKPIDVAGEPVVAQASIGIALGTAATTGVDDLLGQADIAMYRAKAQGKHRYHMYGYEDVLDTAAAADRAAAPASGPPSRRGVTFRKPRVGRPALGPEPG